MKRFNLFGKGLKRLRKRRRALKRETTWSAGYAELTAAARGQWRGLETLEKRILLSTAVVDTPTDVLDGDTSSIAALNATPGADNVISLREAIIAANNGAGDDVIQFAPALDGVPIVLTIAGAGEDGGATGDLDIQSQLAIQGRGARNTIIDGNGLDRVFHLHGGMFEAALLDLTVRNGSSDDGGGIFSTAGVSLAIERSTITGNTATSRGGGIRNDGSMFILDSTISDNTQTGGNEGGGINQNAGNIAIYNSTISGNTGNAGAGITHNTGGMTIINSTIAANNGIGLRDFNGGVSLANTIVADNTGQQIQSNPGITDLGNNISEDGSGITAGSSQSGDPNLGPLQNNGGPTDTHALGAGSLAINQGNNTEANNAGLVNDQRGPGFNRFINTTVDIGAYEAPLPGEVNGTKFNDLNVNGVNDQEPGITGVTIQLRDNDTGEIIDQAVTDINGDYSLMNVAPGFYTAAEIQTPGTRQTAPAQRGFGALIEPELPVDTGNASGLAGHVVGDFNGDLLDDVVVGVAPYGGTPQVQTFINDGDLTFTPLAPVVPSNMPGGEFINLTSGDVDNDGDLDLVLLEEVYANENVTFHAKAFLNDGAGNFSATATDLGVAVGDQPTGSAMSGLAAIAVGDVTGDGNDDITLGTYDDQVNDQLHVFRNDGALTFTQHFSTQLPNDQNFDHFDLQLGDVDNDGDLDALILSEDFGINQLDVQVTRLINSNANPGHFDTPEAPTGVALSLSSEGTGFLGLTDLDSDGNLDAVIAGLDLDQNTFVFQSFIGNGTGDFTPGFNGKFDADGQTQLQGLRYGDVDGDGDEDAIPLVGEPNGEAGQSAIFSIIQNSGVHAFNVQSGGVTNNVDFGNVIAGEIHGLKFEDLNGNGVFDVEPDVTIGNATPGTQFFVQGQSFTPSVQGNEGTGVPTPDGQGNVQVTRVTFDIIGDAPGQLHLFTTPPTAADASSGNGAIATGNHVGGGVYEFDNAAIPFNAKTFAVLSAGATISDGSGNPYAGGVDMFNQGGTISEGNGSFDIGFNVDFAGASEPPLAGVTIYIDANGNGVLDEGELSTVTDVNGEYWFMNLDLGAHVVREIVPPGFAPTLPLGGALGESAPADNEAITLLDGLGLEWDIETDGVIDDGTDDAFDGGFDFDGFNHSGGSLLEADGREVVRIGDAGGNLDVTRKVYVDPELGFARFLDIITNTTAGVLNTTINYDTNLGSDSDTEVLATSSGDLVVDANDNWIVTDDDDAGGDDPAVVHVFAGPGGLRPTSVSRDGDDINWQFDLTLNPGETQIIMLFGAQNFARQGAIDIAPQLGIIDESFRDISTDEATDVVNFTGVAGEGGHLIELVSGEVREDVNFGNAVLGSIHGFKFNDIDRNGIYDPEIDEPAEGVLFDLEGVDGLGRQVNLTGATNGEGEVGFENLLPGDYTMTEQVPQGLAPTTPDFVNLTLASGEELVAFPGQANLEPGDPQHEEVLGDLLKFGNGLPFPGEIRGLKYQDLDGDGEFDEGIDLPTPGITVFIDENGNGDLDPGEPNTVTNGNGEYSFLNMPALVPHIVREILPSGFVQTQPLGGALGDAAPAGNGTITLFDGLGFEWDIRDDGEVSDGTDDAFDGGFDLSGFGSTSSELEAGGREIVRIGAAAGLDVTRKVYVDPTQGFARFLDIFTNTTAGVVNTTINYDTNLGSDSGTNVIATSSGDLVVGTDDDWIVTDDNENGSRDPAVVHAFSGPGGLRPTSISRDGDDIDWQFDLTLAPGETQAIMQYSAQNFVRQEAIDIAPQLALLRESFLGLSSDEAAAVVNFTGVAGEGGHLVELESGEIRENVNFGNFELLEISGLKFADVDGDGIRDPGEPGIGGVEIQLINSLTGRVVKTVRTSAIDLNQDNLIDPFTETGFYTFEDVGPGPFFVAERVPQGFVPTAPSLNESFLLGASGSELYRIDPATGGALLIGDIGFSNVTGMALLNDGRLIGTGQSNEDALFEINPLTGQGTLIGLLDQRLPDLAYDPLTDTLYGHGNDDQLYIVNPNTAALTNVGPTNDGGSGRGLAVDPNTGTIFATPGSQLLTLDPNTGNGTLVPGSDQNIPNRINAMAFDRDSGVLFGSLNSGNSRSLVTIDPVSGATTNLGPTVSRLDALEWAPPPTLGITRVNVTSGQDVSGVDFGNQPIGPPPSIHGQKFSDDNGNGVRDQGEQGIDGFIIELRDFFTGELIAAQATHSMDLDESGGIDPITEQGLYWFDLLAPGFYEVSERDGQGGTQTFPTEPGALLYGAADGNGPSTLYVINPTNGQAQPVGPIGFDNVTGMASLNDGRLIGHGYTNDEGNDAIFEIDPLTGQGTLIGQTNRRFPDLAYDPLTDTLYGHSSSDQLFAINPDTGESTEIGSTNFGGGGRGAAVDPFTGTIFATPGSQLITIDPVDGSGTFVPGSDGNIPNRLNALDFNPLTGELFGSFNFDNDSYSLVTVDPADGATTVIGPSANRLDALAWHPVDTQGTYLVTLGGGDVIEGLDFGNADITLGGSIHGQKFNDLDGDGIRDEGEEGLNNIAIELFDVNLQQVVDTQLTHSMNLDEEGEINPITETGLYWFQNVPAGDYIVREVVPTNAQQTFPIATQYQVSIVDGQTIENLDFGNSLTSLPPDLTAQIANLDPGVPLPLVPGDVFQAAITFGNEAPAPPPGAIGEPIAQGLLQYQVFASEDQQLDANDILIHEADVGINLGRGEQLQINPLINFVGDGLLPDDQYFLLVVADTGNAFLEVDESNNTGVTGESYLVDWVAQDGRPLVLVDNGETVTTTVTGPGRVDFLTNGVTNILASGTDTTTNVGVNITGGDGVFTINNLDITSNISQFDAPGFAVDGDVNMLAGDLLTLGDLASPHVINIGTAATAGQSIALTFGRLIDVTINSLMGISSLVAVEYFSTDTDTPEQVESLNAPWVGSVFITGGGIFPGDANFHMNLTGAGAPNGTTLGSAVIAGNLFASIWDIIGDVGDLVVNLQTASFVLDVHSNVNSINLTGNVNDTNIDVDDNISQLHTGGNFDNGSVEARQLTNATIDGDVNNSVVSLLEDVVPGNSGIVANQSFTTLGLWVNSDLLSRGHLGDLRFGGMEDSLVSLGTVDQFLTYDQSSLPDTTDDFAVQGTIQSVVISGNNNPSRASFIDTIVRAYRIGTIRLLDVVGTDVPNSGNKFGFALKEVDSYERFTPERTFTRIPDKKGHYQLRVVLDSLEGLIPDPEPGPE